jgi:hypothetical protein
VVFQRGVFRVDEEGRNVAALCIPVQGRWKQVGTLSDCGDAPPPERRRELSRFEPDRTILGIRNLGVSSADWDKVQRARKSGAADNRLRRIAEAFTFDIGATDTRWRFESRKLPQELKADIPGSGIHVHFGGFFSTGRGIALVDPKGGDFEVEVRLAVPTYTHTGKAHTGLTLAVDLRALKVDGTSEEIPVIVSLLHQDPRSREVLMSDGRVSFVGSFLGPNTRYIQAVENREHRAAWKDPQTFAFRVSRENVLNIMSDLNARRRTAGASPFDEKSVSKVRVVGVTLRNESRFIDQGDVAVEVAVDYLRLNRAGGSK